MGEIKELLSSLLREKGRSAGQYQVGVLVCHQQGCADTGLPSAELLPTPGHQEKERPGWEQQHWQVRVAIGTQGEGS